MKSYKIHIQEKLSEDEWFVVENTHEAIIEKEAAALYAIRQHAHLALSYLKLVMGLSD